MLELRIISPSADGFLKEIEWNHEEIKKEVAAKMKEYTGLVYADDDLKKAKADRAHLNKFVTAIEDARKQVKKQCMAPYERFEKQVREITYLVDEPIKLIDKQLQEAERVRKEEKYSQIAAIYHDNIGTLKGILPLEKLMKPDYLNVSKSLKSIEKEMLDGISQVNKEMDTIEGLKSPFELQMKETYVRTMSLSAALQEKERMEELDRKLREKQEEEQRRKEQVKNTASIESRSRTVKSHGIVETKPEIYVVSLDIRGTKEQLTAFQDFLNRNGIGYDVTAKARKEN